MDLYALSGICAEVVVGPGSGAGRFRGQEKMRSLPGEEHCTGMICLTGER